MIHPVPDQRVLRGSSSTLSYQFLDADGAPTSPAGTVTVGVVDAAGATVVAAGTATSGATSAPRTYSMAARNTLDLLTVTWTDGGDSSTHEQLVEIVGGYYFSAAEFVAVERQGRYSPDAVIAARRSAEETCELATGVSWVPRYRRVALDGSGESGLQLADPMLRSVRSVRVYSDATTYDTWTAADLARVRVAGDAAEAGIARLTSGVWPRGYQNLVVEYEHGYNSPPHDIKRAVMRHARAVINEFAAAATDGAERWQAADGTVVYRAIPAGYRTGYPDIDAVYERRSLRVGGFA